MHAPQVGKDAVLTELLVHFKAHRGVMVNRDIVGTGDGCKNPVKRGHLTRVVRNIETLLDGPCDGGREGGDGVANLHVFSFLVSGLVYVNYNIKHLEICKLIRAEIFKLPTH